MKQKNKFFTFVFSMLPGAGHMFLGLQRQGIQLMILFFASIFIASFLHAEIFLIFVPVIWCYSFFDAMHKNSSEEIPQDTDIIIASWLFDGSLKIKNKARWIAYTLIFLGAYLLFERVALPAIEQFMSWEVRNYTQTVVLAIILIGGGIKLLAGSKVPLESNKEDKSI